MTPVVLFSLTVHEYSHGRVAYYLGDDTAKRLGRLSFNPLKHIDPLGALCFYFMGFGWAKPVPVDWRNFDNPRKDLMYVSVAGPASNIMLAFICGFFVRIISPYELPVLFYLSCFGVYINVALCIFNLLPIFPLDGSSVLKGLVSQGLAIKIMALDRFGTVLILAVFLIDHFAHTGIIWYLIGYPIIFVTQLLTQEAFPLLENVLLMTFS